MPLLTVKGEFWLSIRGEAENLSTLKGLLEEWWISHFFLASSNFLILLISIRLLLEAAPKFIASSVSVSWTVLNCEQLRESLFSSICWAVDYLRSAAPFWLFIRALLRTGLSLMPLVLDLILKSLFSFCALKNKDCVTLDKHVLCDHWGQVYEDTGDVIKEEIVS